MDEGDEVCPMQQWVPGLHLIARRLNRLTSASISAIFSRMVGIVFLGGWLNYTLNSERLFHSKLCSPY